MNNVTRIATPDQAMPRPRLKPADKLLLIIGACGPIGFLPASGTFAVAFVGVPLYWWTHDWPVAGLAVFLAACLIVAIVIHDRMDKAMGTKDSGKIVWDEFVGFQIATAFIGVFTWRIAVTAFLVERVLDIAKAPPADRIERRWPGAWGVVGDDVIAGLYTRLVLQVLLWTMPGSLGVTP